MTNPIPSNPLPMAIALVLVATLAESAGPHALANRVRLSLVAKDLFPGVEQRFWGAQGADGQPGEALMGLRTADGWMWVTEKGVSRSQAAWEHEHTETGQVVVPLENLEAFQAWAGQAEDPRGWRTQANQVGRPWDMLGRGLLFHKDPNSPPIDEPAFVEDLWDFSCHPYFGRSIARSLNTEGVRATTVQTQFFNGNYDRVVLAVAKHGVCVQPTWAMPQDGPKEVPEAERDVPPPRIHRGP